MPWGTIALAPMMLYSPICAWLRTVACMPIRTWCESVAPWTIAVWPITQSGPMVQGAPGSA